MLPIIQMDTFNTLPSASSSLFNIKSDFLEHLQCFYPRLKISILNPLGNHFEMEYCVRFTTKLRAPLMRYKEVMECAPRHHLQQQWFRSVYCTRLISDTWLNVSHLALPS